MVERPPRYDKEKNDPNGTKQMLSQTANGILMSMITPLDHVHLIKLPGLDNLSPKARRGVYQHDGIHLTNRGASILADHITCGVRKVFKDIPIPVEEPLRNQFKTPPPNLTHSSPGYAGRSSHPQAPGHPGGWHGQQGQGSQNGQNRYSRRRREDDMPDMVRDYMMGFSDHGYNNHNNYNSSRYRR